MTTAVTERTNALGMIESTLVQGDLSGLSQEGRLEYYRRVCASLGLNPLTRPFEYLELDKKLVLYARRDCTDQLRKIHAVTVTITDRRTQGDVYIVTAQARMPDGRMDESTGAVALEKEQGEWKTAQQSGKRYFAGNGQFVPLRGEALANAMMRAETKAKRRVTLSICGLGLLDEMELETIPDARVVEQTPREPLPAPQPTNGGKPKVPIPEQVKNAEAKLVEAALCKPGELSAYLVTALGGTYAGPIAAWPWESRADVIEAVVAFKAEREAALPCSQEDQDALERELTRTGEDWLRAMAKVKCDPKTSPADLTRGEVQQLLEALKPIRDKGE